MILATLITLQYESSPSYYDKTRARAGNEAALLMTPELLSQAYRFPANAFDPTLAGGAGNFQLRVGASLSVSDFYKGFRVMSTARADCRQQRVRQQIERVLMQGRDAGRVSALRRQVEFLSARQARWRELGHKAEERFNAHIITLVDLHDMRKRVWALDRQISQARGELSRLQEAPNSPPPQGLDDLTMQYAANVDQYEDESAFVRALSAWQLRLTGGLVPLQGSDSGFRASTDWYALVEVRLSLGIFSSSGAYLRARAAEVRNADYEVPARVKQFIGIARASLEASKQELLSVREQVESTKQARATIEHSDAPKAAHTASMLELDEIQFEADRAFLETLISELQVTVGENHG